MIRRPRGGRLDRRLGTIAGKRDVAANGVDFRLLQAGDRSPLAIWIRRVEPEAFGLLGTVADPDGKFIQVTQAASLRTPIEEEASKESSEVSR
jgi:hypothetical protein